MTEERSPAQEIAETLRRIADLDIETQLVRSRDLGAQLDFTPYHSLFENAKAFAARAAELPWITTSSVTQNAIVARVRSFDASITEVQTFSPRDLPGHDLQNEKEERAGQVESTFQSFKHHATPVMGFLFWEGVNIERYQQELSDLTEDARKKASEITTDMESQKVDAEKVLAAIREAAAEQGVSQESETFHNAAKRYELSAQRWLKVAIFSGISTAIAAILSAILFSFLWSIDGQITDATVLQVILAKAALLAIFIYATVTAVRLYRSSAHLAAVNRHRDDALRTFQTFVEGTATSETKDQVLLAAARAAFGQVSTGLVTDKGDGASVLEVLGGISSSLTRRS